MARLRIKREGREDELVPISSDIVTLGRSSEATIPIEDQGASRKHAQIERCEGGYKLVDLESRNGTRVNGVHVNQHLLQWNDEIQIGKTVLLWEAGDSELLPPESSGEMTPAAAAVAGVKPPRVHITRRRTRTVRRGGPGVETKVLAAIVVVSVLGGLVVFLKREDPAVVDAKAHMGSASAVRQKAEAYYQRPDPSSQTMREQIDLFTDALREYRAVPASVPDYARQAAEKAAEVEQAIQRLKEALPGFRAQEVRDFAKAHPAEIDAIKKLVAEFRTEFPGHPEGAKLDAMVKEMTAAKPEDLTAKFAAVEAEVDAFLAQDKFGGALAALAGFADQHPSSAFSQKAEQRMKDLQAQAGDFWNAEHAKAQALAKEGKTADAIAVYERVISACGDQSLLSDLVLQARSELKALKDKKDK